MWLERLRSTRDERAAGVIRYVLGLVFISAGAMKLFVPMLADAWSGQLLAAELPFYTLTRWSVPFVEILIGVMLTAGYFVRLASLVVIGMMVVATYVHMVVDDPGLFPLQPSEPIIPLIVIGMAGYTLWRGGGAWSFDLKAWGRT